MLISNFYWNTNLEHKLRIFEIVILNRKWADCKPARLVNEKFYVHEIAAVNLRKFTSWKTQRKHANQTTAINIAIEQKHLYYTLTDTC